MSSIDRWVERATRQLARRTGRRGFLSRIGTILAGGAMLPLLPVARGFGAVPYNASGQDADLDGPEGDPTKCEYWRHCSIDGFLCSCCGGSVSRGSGCRCPGRWWKRIG